MGKTGQTKAAMQKLRLEAEKLYHEKVPANRIYTKCGISHTTFYGWVKKYGWDKTSKVILESVKKDLHTDIAKEKAKSLRIIALAEQKYLKCLNQLEDWEDLPKGTGAFAQLQKVKWEILTPRQVTNFNFTKNENNLTINVELKKLLEDTRNGLGR